MKFKFGDKVMYRRSPSIVLPNNPECVFITIISQTGMFHLVDTSKLKKGWKKK